jgi:hypothetical protein
MKPSGSNNIFFKFFFIKKEKTLSKFKEKASNRLTVCCLLPLPSATYFLTDQKVGKKSFAH